jgi:hypothetical protein
LKLVGREHRQEILPFNGNSRPELLRKLILLRPGAMVRANIEWTMADTENIGKDALFFNFGRITKKQKDRFDRDNRSFYAMMDDDIDRVSCFYDCNLQILAIEKKPSAPTPSTISNYIRKVILSCKDNIQITNELIAEEKALLSLTRPSIDFISDPVEFIEYLSNSYKVTYFQVFFGPGNPHDYEETLQKPMQRLLDATAGEEAGASVFSQYGLNKNKIIDIAHAAAAYGDDARAKVYHADGGIGETIRLKKKCDNAFIEIAIDSVVGFQAKIIELIKERYRRIRGSDS